MWGETDPDGTGHVQFARADPRGLGMVGAYLDTLIGALSGPTDVPFATR